MSLELSNSSSIFNYNPDAQLNMWNLGSNVSVTIEYSSFPKWENSNRVFSYMLETVAKQLNMSDMQMEIAQKVQEFCTLHSISATNNKVLADPQDAIDVFVVRLIKKVYQEKLSPMIKNMVDLFESLWSSSESFLQTTFNNKGIEILKDEPLFITKQNFQLECDQWKINYNHENQKRLEDFFHVVENWYSFRLLHSYNKEPKRFAEMSHFIEKIKKAKKVMDEQFPNFAQQCSRVINPNYKGTVVGTENYLPFARAKLLLKDYVIRILTPDIKSVYDYYQKLANRVIQKYKLSEDHFDL